MKRSLLLLPAVALAVFGALLALDIVNFEQGLAGETSQIDRWVMIFSFGGVAAFIGLASADTSSNDDDEATGRAVAARKLGEGRPDPSELPSKPGSLLKKVAAPAEREVVRAGINDTDDTDDDANTESPILTEALTAESIEVDDAKPIADEPLVETEEPIDVSLIDEPVEASASSEALVATGMPSIDPVDAELQSLIDDDQMQEINELVAAAAEAEAAEEEGDAIVPGSESVEPLARLELRLADYDDEDLKRVVKESESVVISEMVRTGQLSSEGALTEKDIASMVFLAYTSDEMLTELRLRKTLDQHSPDQAGLEASTGSDFAPLKNIE